MSLRKDVDEALGDSILGVAIRNAGIRSGWKACTYLAVWGIGSERAGHPLHTEEVPGATGWSRPKAFRLQAEFRQAFPGETTPERLWSALRLGGWAADADGGEVVARVANGRYLEAA